MLYFFQPQLHNGTVFIQQIYNIANGCHCRKTQQFLFQRVAAIAKPSQQQQGKFIRNSCSTQERKRIFTIPPFGVDNRISTGQNIPPCAFFSLCKSWFMVIQYDHFHAKFLCQCHFPHSRNAVIAGKKHPNTFVCKLFHGFIVQSVSFLLAMGHIISHLTAAFLNGTAQYGGTHDAIHVIIPVNSNFLSFFDSHGNQVQPFFHILHFQPIMQAGSIGIQEIMGLFSGKQFPIGKNCRRRLLDAHICCHGTNIYFCTFQLPAFHGNPPFSLIIKKALHLTGNAKPFLDFPSNGICNAFQINLWKKRKWSDCGTIPPDAVLQKGNVHKLLR